jgi:hypothetical protein
MYLSRVARVICGRYSGTCSAMLLRLLAVAVLACVLALGSASASEVDPETCPYGAVSAVGPVDADGNGDDTPAVACLDAP